MIVLDVTSQADDAAAELRRKERLAFERRIFRLIRDCHSVPQSASNASTLSSKVA